MIRKNDKYDKFTHQLIQCRISCISSRFFQLSESPWVSARWVWAHRWDEPLRGFSRGSGWAAFVCGRSYSTRPSPCYIFRLHTTDHCQPNAIMFSKNFSPFLYELWFTMKTKDNTTNHFARQMLARYCRSSDNRSPATALAVSRRRSRTPLNFFFYCACCAYTIGLLSVIVSDRILRPIAAKSFARFAK